MREVGEREGVPLVVNARTDVYLRQVGEPEGRFEEAVRRLNAYRAAGADCLFATGFASGETIGRLVAALDGPFNVFAYPGVPSIEELERLGVRRLSIGPQAQRAGLAQLTRIAEQLLEQRNFAFVSEAMTRAEVEELMNP